MKPALFTPAAEADVEAAFQWYDFQRPGLGVAFRHALDIAVEAVVSNPEAYAVIHSGDQARASAEVPYGLVLPSAGRRDRGGRLYSREATPNDMARSLRPAFNALKLTKQLSAVLGGPRGEGRVQCDRWQCC